MNAVWKDSVSFLLCTHSQTCFPSVFVSHSFFLFFLNECISLQFVTPLTIYGFLCARVLTLLFSVPCWTLNSKYNMAEWRHMTGTNPNRHNNFLSVTRWGKERTLSKAGVSMWADIEAAAYVPKCSLDADECAKKKKKMCLTNVTHSMPPITWTACVFFFFS